VFRGKPLPELERAEACPWSETQPADLSLACKFDAVCGQAVDSCSCPQNPLATLLLSCEQAVDSRPSTVFGKGNVPVPTD
jgi:hypothetical protein